jgi:hypothetical protein
MVEKVVKNVSTASEEISPQSFYSLVVDTFACNMAPSILSGPLKGCDNMYHAISVFSPPLSDRTGDGRPNFSTADLKC